MLTHLFLRRMAAQRRRLVLAFLALSGSAWLLTSPIAADPPAHPRIAVIPIHDEINDVLFRSLERRIERARKDGADVLVFEMKTPGGLVTSALEISSLIKSQKGVHTIAWVHDQAYSAGALISVACQEILMSDPSKIGDCAPIMITPVGGLEQLNEAERAKAEGPVLQDFRDSAARNGYDPLLCRAMVSVGEEVWWIERGEDGERRFVDGAEKKRLIDDVVDSDRQWRLVTHFADPVGGASRAVAQPIDSSTQLLTLSQSEAVAFGLARGIADSVSDIQMHLNSSAQVATYDISGWEQFAIWLNSPLVRGILFVIMIVGAYVEFHTPGVWIPGLVALVSLAIFLAAPYAAGLADVWTLIVLALGLILLGLEIFIIPGFGVAGILGILFILGALVGTFVPREPNAPTFGWPTMQATWDGLKFGIGVLSVSVIASSLGIVLLARYLPQFAVARGLIPPNPSEPITPPMNSSELVGLEGDVGMVVSPLRPGGRARFGSHVIEVHSQGEYVEVGARVQVLRREGMTVFVRQLTDGAA